MGTFIARLRNADRRQAAILLAWSCLLVLPIGRVVEVPVMVMALAGVYLLVKDWQRFRDDPAARLFAVVFLLYWIPIVLALVDAVYIDSALRKAFAQLRFAFAGVFMLHALSTARAQSRFLGLCAWLLLFWVADGVVQLVAGRDLLGFALVAGRVNALFGEEGLVYGILLGVLCPMLWEYAARHWSRWQLVAVIFATVAAVLAAGERSAWINVAVIVLAYAVLVWRRRGRFPLRLAAAGVASVVVVVALLSVGSPQFSKRLHSALGAVTGDTPIMQDAVGHRMWIWKGAINMIEDNPLIGVGAGGFRYAFPDYAAEGDPFVNADPPIRPSHAHQLWLQTLSETGLVGAAGLAILLLVLVAVGVRAPVEARRAMRPYAVCLLAAYFPFNTHMAIYSSFWSQIVWWLIALYCAAYGAALAGARDAVRREGAPAAPE